MTIVAEAGSGKEQRFGRVELLPEDLKRAAGSSPKTPIVVELGPGVSITGTVTVDDKPAPKVEMQLSRHVGPGGLARMGGGFTSKPITTATTDQTGTYRFIVGPEDGFSVSVRKPPVEGGNTWFGYSPTCLPILLCRLWETITDGCRGSVPH